MKTLLILFLFISQFFNFHSTQKTEYFKDKIALRCVGSSPCAACSNCSACKWCSAGGTCGVCESWRKKGDISSKKYNLQKPDNTTTQDYYTGQCKAMTKKGKRCSRTARTNGYCWQHGG